MALVARVYARLPIGVDLGLLALKACLTSGGTVVHINAASRLATALMLGKRIGYGKEPMHRITSHYGYWRLTPLGGCLAQCRLGVGWHAMAALAWP